jgi:hypothetical protein
LGVIGGRYKAIQRRGPVGEHALQRFPGCLGAGVFAVSTYSFVT